MIRIGVNPIGWSNDDMPEIGGNIPLETCLEEARTAGFTGMELGNKFPRQAEQLQPILVRYGHALVGGWYSTHLLTRNAREELQAAKDHAVLLRDMGSKIFIAAETSNAIHSHRQLPLSARPVLPKAAWKEFGKRCTEFARAIEGEYGLRLVYHHHMGTVVQNEAEIDRFMAVTGDAVHLLLDTGHAAWGGADPARLARHYSPRIGHFHAKDVREEVMLQANAEDWSFLDAVLAGVYTVPGDGMIDYVQVLRELKGYSGWAVVEAEQDPEKANPARYAELGYRNLSACLKEAGFEIA
ncbi:inosose dehydratase/3D-(3,5/4)-trihydroxycyclohexane-1,2-dione acylhydrolase (decyclizing) [Mesorhizobium sp. J18]|uniref:myo-inosose-2 dehydratase n=1 Tax=Mesorhizobium sp. J18 TaxID=935263 RepID=UPI0011997FEE|nr:myo-inosose-2 dehydratase [Mesorhizobium sp. J18]TWG98264.1 inosose dehydratase/3D-(3,5/4)-trihydroxycyclohexane-1,2-dione acylhydrolase (decyclizing) [Mesorhizobium sp. J18]